MNVHSDHSNFFAPPTLLKFMSDTAEAASRRRGRRGASPIPRKSEPRDDPSAIGEELMPMRSMSNELYS